MTRSLPALLLLAVPFAVGGQAKATGKEFTARFAHVWTLHGGKIVQLQQCADTVQLARAVAQS